MPYENEYHLSVIQSIVAVTVKSVKMEKVREL